MARIYLLRENSEWLVPLEAAFREQDLPYELWSLDEGSVDLAATPPGIEVAGIEFIRRPVRAIVTCDVKTNTNYLPQAEAAAGRYGMGKLARFLGRELAADQRQRAA